jgi:hypothetical protein
VLGLADGYSRTHSFRVSKMIHAPLPFVYAWCTDYSESDPKITGSKARRKILLKAGRHVIYTSSYRSGGKPKIGVNIVTLHPPNRWHLDFIGDEDDETGDYRLTRLGPRRTRLNMSFTEHYRTRDAPTKAQDAAHVHEIWDKYAARLERDYKRKNR